MKKYINNRKMLYFRKKQIQKPKCNAKKSIIHKNKKGTFQKTQIMSQNQYEI